MKRLSPVVLAFAAAVVCAASSSTVVRGQSLTNAALSTNGATASASTTLNGGYPASGVINGDRRGLGWAQGTGGWHDATGNNYADDWVQVTFPDYKMLSEIDVFTLQDNFNNPVDPTPEMTFTQYGITHFQVFHLTPQGWLLVPGGEVTNNNKVWTKLTFATPLRALAVRLVVLNAANSFSRVVEVEAWSSSLVNVAASSTGAVAYSTSTFNANYPPAAANNGDRSGRTWGTSTGGWNDATQGQYSADALTVQFGGNRVISEIDVFTLRNNFQDNQTPPTLSETFGTADNSGNGVIDFDVQYLSGSGWVTIDCGNAANPCGQVVGNNKVWRQFIFSPVTTSAIRVAVHKAAPWTIANNYSRLVEVEAWGYDPNANEQVWVEDAVPSGAVVVGDADGWNWVSNNPPPLSGMLAHKSLLLGGIHQHYFHGASGASALTVGAGDRLFAYVFLDAANPPSSVMLQWNDGTWEHRAYWGANQFPWGADGTVSRRYMGPLPALGKWVRLEVPAGLVGLEGRTLNGMAFSLHNGRATWDRAGKVPAASEQVWVEDAPPSGVVLAPENDGWNWVSANPPPVSGSLSHQSATVAGIHQHYFYGASGASALTVNAGDRLFAYVFLDPASPPNTVMLQWNDGTWEHRAYWGANNMPWGVDGTASRRYMGPLPSTGHWVRLEVPAAQVGLEGRTLNAMAFSLHGGRATWDRAGKTASASSTNVARTGTAQATSQFNANFPASAVIDGERTGFNWGRGGFGSGWADATENVYGADVLQVNFSNFVPRAVSEIDVFTLRDGFSTKIGDPAPDETFNTAPNTGEGIRYFEVEYWDGARWRTVPGGLVANNNKVWTRLQFAPINTAAVRVVVRDGALWTTIGNNHSRIVEVEAWAADASASAYEVGQWSPQEFLDEVPVHISMLPDGRLLYWGRDKAMDGYDINGVSRTFLWNPVTKARKTVVNTTTNLFCSSHSLLPDGRLLVTGGHTRDDRWPQIEALGEDDLNIFNPANDTWALAAHMSKRRWYPSSVTLANGDVVFFAGAHWDDTYDPQGLPTIDQNRIPELYRPSTNQVFQMGQAGGAFVNYPFLHAAPNGKMVWTGPGNTPTLYYDPYANGMQGEFSNITFTAVHPLHYEGVSVLYDSVHGRILKVGGRTTTGGAVDDELMIIDLSNVGGGWGAFTPITYGRKFHTGTLLPDGKVLITGGTRCAGSNNIACPEGAATRPEMYDPNTNSWKVFAPNPSLTPRAYHSVALLLPDARVLVGGGGLPAAGGEMANGELCVEGQISSSYNCRTFGHKDIEIFSPPYLFAPNGQPAARPVITSAPATVAYGQTFFVGATSAGGVGSVALVRLPSVTHGMSFDQRRVALSFQATTGGLNVTAPAGGALCPPGHYMLFVLNAGGTPSIARIIRVG